MATADQLRALARKVGRGDLLGTRAVMEQIAEHVEAKGQARLSEDLHSIMAAAERQRESSLKVRGGSVAQRDEERGWITEVNVSRHSRRSIVFTEAQAIVFDQVVQEQRRAKELYHHNLEPTRRWLLCGPPGTGKSLTAAVLAAELDLPLLRVNVHALVSRYLGETAQNIAQVFEEIEARRGVYLFDEFDSIARARYGGQDSGEMDRVVNAVLQLIENDASQSLLLATSNAPAAIDEAFARRFDEVSFYPLPGRGEVRQLIGMYLPAYGEAVTDVEKALSDLSHADVVAILRRVSKDVLLNGGALDRGLVEGHARRYRASKEVIGRWSTLRSGEKDSH